MFEDLQFGVKTVVTPRKLARKGSELPAPIAQAFDDTPLGEAAEISVQGADAKAGVRLVSLLKRHAKEGGFVAFKASFEAGKLYWQKKKAVR